MTRSRKQGRAPEDRGPKVPRVARAPTDEEMLRVAGCDEGAYASLLAVKVKAAIDMLSAAVPSLPVPEVHESPKSGFRQRANFAVWHDGDKANFVMFDSSAERKTPLITDQFPRADKRINELMTGVLEAVRTNEMMRVKLSEVRFHTTLRGDALVMMAYNAPLGEEWKAAATLLHAELSKKGECSLIGRSRKIKVVVGRDFVEETLVVGDRELKYAQLEGEFSQPNGAVCEKMLRWAVSCSKRRETKGDLLELYCGNGNFTVALAPNFGKCLATELSKANTNNARENMERNGMEPPQIVVARLSAEDVSQALGRVRDFTRLKELNVDLDSYELTTLFVDPPRSGLDDKTREDLAPTFENILYVSCNPETLARDMKHFSATHDVQNFALFDQFPYTTHLECGVLLTKRREPEDDAPQAKRPKVDDDAP